MILTPAAINKYIKSILDHDKYLREFMISGEVSNVKYHSNGNIYFRIKDSEAQIDATMFASYARNNDFKLTEGQQIEALVNLSTIVKMGKYSLNVRKIKLSGQGRLYELYRQLQEQLQKEGLFSQAHKQQLVMFPKRIGIVTSPTGAAIQDMISTLKRRHPIAEIVIVPCLVQGKSATNDIVKKLELADNSNFDVIITGRGGGSIEDLWCFNEEAVVRTIYQMQTPVISSVGHESDTTLSDFVADVRAATPTAAAELAACDLMQVQKINLKNYQFIKNTVQLKVKRAKENLNYLAQSRSLTEPLMSKKIIFDNLNWQLVTNAHQLTNRLNQANYQLRELQLSNLIKQKIQVEQQKVDLIHKQIDGLNPLAILSRGYATTKQANNYINNAKDIEENQELEIQMHDGVIKSLVTKKELYEK